MPEELRQVVERYGGVPLLIRTLKVPRATVEALRAVGGGNIGAAALLWNEEGQVLLVRQESSSDWGENWVAPGGGARPGEGPEETLLREVWEEVGIKPQILDLSCVFELTVTDGKTRISGYFFQFEALASSTETRPGPKIAETRWFDALPHNMAFRDDYLEAFRMRRGESSRKRP